MSRVLATFFGVGLMRPAPGTWGSAVAVVLGLAIDRFLGFPALVVATVAVTALGFWACARVCGPGDDPSEVVIDEVAGQWLALLFPAAAFWHRGLEDWAVVAYPGWIAAFLFFRLFDIWKPWPVSWADDHVHGGLGAMLDDAFAGIYACICLHLAIFATAQA